LAVAEVTDLPPSIGQAGAGLASVEASLETWCRAATMGTWLVATGATSVRTSISAYRLGFMTLDPQVRALVDYILNFLGINPKLGFGVGEEPALHW